LFGFRVPKSGSYQYMDTVRSAGKCSVTWALHYESVAKIVSRVFSEASYG